MSPIFSECHILCFVWIIYQMISMNEQVHKNGLKRTFLDPYHTLVIVETGELKQFPNLSHESRRYRCFSTCQPSDWVNDDARNDMWVLGMLILSFITFKFTSYARHLTGKNGIE